jgi:hypothetical protein
MGNHPMEEYFREQSFGPNASRVRYDFMASGRAVSACLLTGLK